MDLQGRTILITGAARGIGAESARKLAARGANVALVGLEPEELARVAEQCGPGAAAFEADITDVDALSEAVESAVERFGGIDVVMANAGVAGTGMVRSMDPAAFERTVEVNLLGVWRTVRLCLPHVIERKGYVLTIASLAAVSHAPGMGPYAASKAGVEAFANVLRAEVRHLGVDVGVGYFAFIDTDMVRGSDAHPVFGKMRSKLPRPLAKTYPLADVGDAVVDGIVRRRRWVTVPSWIRAAIMLRGPLQHLGELGARGKVAEVDAEFAADIATRGAEAASAPVGAGGQAAAVRRERSRT
jgi:NAD(P)-dependent dehydrogenase (short-subunit alcohol dehydrogenase family)